MLKAAEAIDWEEKTLPQTERKAVLSKGSLLALCTLHTLNLISLSGNLVLQTQKPIWPGWLRDRRNAHLCTVWERKPLSCHFQPAENLFNGSLKRCTSEGKTYNAIFAHFPPVLAQKPPETETPPTSPGVTLQGTRVGCLCAQLQEEEHCAQEIHLYSHQCCRTPPTICLLTQLEANKPHLPLLQSRRLQSQSAHCKIISLSSCPSFPPGN